MDITIIIPIYNVEAYILDCLRSVASQTCLSKGVRVECILVDDCGTDESVAMCEQFVSDYVGPMSFRILHHEHNRGLSAARNTGMDVAQGEYVLFLDSDDTITPDCLEKLYAKAKETAADVTYGSYKTVGRENKEYTAADIPFVTAWNKLCKRSFLQRNNIQFVEGLIHEDCPWSFEIECKGASYAHITDITYLYLVREGSLQTGKDFDKHFTAYMQILQIYADIIASVDYDERYAHYLEKQKALYFGLVISGGTAAQSKQLYELIRRLGPKLHDNKADWHYYMFERMGYLWYRRFYKYHLC